MVVIDADILNLCVKNDRKAQKILYEYCFRKWMPLCLRYHENSEDARSSLNLGFLKIINNLPNQNLNEIKFDGWAKRIISNTLIDIYRKQTRHDKHYQSTDNERDLEMASQNSLNDGFENLNYEFLLSLLQQLPDSARMVFNLYAIDGYSHQEIAEMLDIPIGTSKWNLSNARRILKELLEKSTDKSTLYEVYRS